MQGQCSARATSARCDHKNFLEHFFAGAIENAIPLHSFKEKNLLSTQSKQDNSYAGFRIIEQFLTTALSSNPSRPTS
jgi:hypothetical protein